MLLKFTLMSGKPIVLPLSYNHMVQSMFYRLLYDKIPWLHDHGFTYMKRRFKLFVFSKIFSKKFEVKKPNIIFHPPIKIFFASPIHDIVNELANAILKNDRLEIGRNELFVSKVTSRDWKIESEEIVVKTLSPITVYRTLENKKTLYYSPNQPEFQELIAQNLSKKAKILNINLDPFNDFRIEPIDYVKRATRYKGFFIQCWEGKFKLSGEKAIIKLALDSGIGAKNPQGFGLLAVGGLKV